MGERDGEPVGEPAREPVGERLGGEGGECVHEHLGVATMSFRVEASGLSKQGEAMVHLEEGNSTGVPMGSSQNDSSSSTLTVMEILHV